jgi:C-terminal processing protease CtpA/Prc
MTLPHSGVAIDVPLLAGSYEADTPDTGVAPDIEVPPSFGARAAQRDVEMEAALRVIRKR